MDMRKIIALISSVILMIALCGYSYSDGCKNTASGIPNPVVINMPGDKTVNGYRVSVRKNEDGTVAQSIRKSGTEEDGEVLYFANISSKKFHRPDCGFASKILGKNLYTTESRGELTTDGYAPCGVCKP